MNRKKFGHDLVKLATEAVRLEIHKLVTFTPEHWENITKANAYYRSKGFEYFEITKAVTAYPDLPDLKLLAQLASDLVEPLRQFARNVA